MLTTFRRGEIAGAQVARSHPELREPEAIRQSAELVFGWFQERGYAPIEPREEFLSGYTSNFCIAALIADGRLPTV